MEKQVIEKTAFAICVTILSLNAQIEHLKQFLTEEQKQDFKSKFSDFPTETEEFKQGFDNLINKLTSVPK